MDNKKAIDLLNLIKFENAECNLGTWYHGIDGDMKEALEMAIKALKQKTCEDTISRREVKEQMIKYGFHAPDMTVTEFVEGLPPVITKKTKIDWNYGEIKELTNEYHPKILNNYLEGDLATGKGG